MAHREPRSINDSHTKQKRANAHASTRFSHNLFQSLPPHPAKQRPRPYDDERRGIPKPPSKAASGCFDFFSGCAGLVASSG